MGVLLEGLEVSQEEMRPNEEVSENKCDVERSGNSKKLVKLKKTLYRGGGLQGGNVGGRRKDMKKDSSVSQRKSEKSQESGHVR